MENIDYSGITELDLPNKQLNELPDLAKYTNLEILDCSDNYLVNIENLPLGLKELKCKLNPLIYDFQPTIPNIIYYNLFKHIT